MQSEDNHECSADALDSSTSSAAGGGQHMETQQLALQPSPPKQNPNVLWVIIKGIVIAFVVFIFFLLLGIATAAVLHLVLAGGPPYSRRPRRSLSSSSSSFSDDSDPSSAFTVEELRRLLPCFEYSDDNTTKKDCAICLDNFHGGERIRRLPNCNHTFHSNCVENWLTRVSNCPICRLRLNFMSTDS